MTETVAALDLKPGALVTHRGRDAVLLMLLDLQDALVRDLTTGRTERVRIQDLTLPMDRMPAANAVDDLAVIPDEDWNVAQERMRFIRPLLRAGRTIEDVKAQAEKAGVHHATVYRWIQKFEEDGKVSALLPTPRRGGKGKSRLEPAVEEILQRVLNEVYLTKQRVTITKTWQEVKLRCDATGLDAPHENTVRSRIAILSDFLKLHRRVGSREARQAYALDKGSFPGADYPLAVVQIDHTPMDVILVDEEARRPIGRPWITVAIDVYSRMILGYYISLDPPSSHSVGMCLAHAVLPKEVWLAKHDLATAWPCWGLMRTAHVDNGKEFRGRTLRRACEQYGITIEYRPVLQPSFGGHIERLMGTLAIETHMLKGTTFSSIHERGNYDSRGQAVFTIKELERWLAVFIVENYHQREHSSLEGQSPLQRWEEGILGTGKRPGVGVPKRLADERRLRLDFLPFEERTIQQYGVAIDGITYSNDILRRYAHAKDPENPRAKQKFTFRRDPRDISVIYFFDPLQKDYQPIPYRNTSWPAISIWELREAIRTLKKERREKINEALIFEAIRKMRAIQDSASRETLKTRRARVRRTLHQASAPHVQHLQSSGGPAKPAAMPRSHEAPVLPLRSARVVAPFDEID